MYRNLSEKFQNLIDMLSVDAAADDPMLKAATELRDAVMHEVKLAYGLVWNDNAQACQDNLEELLTNEEMDEGRALVDSQNDNYEFETNRRDPNRPLNQGDDVDWQDDEPDFPDLPGQEPYTLVL